jgi:hypothetical protein
MPPPIQSTITQSAVAFSLGRAWMAPDARRGAPAASAPNVAALTECKKSRRVKSRVRDI